MTELMSRSKTRGKKEKKPPPLADVNITTGPSDDHIAPQIPPE